MSPIGWRIVLSVGLQYSDLSVPSKPTIDRSCGMARPLLRIPFMKPIAMIDKVWKRIEKDAVAGIDDKDRKRLRKLLRQIERNLGVTREEEPDLMADEDEPQSAELPAA